MEQELFCMHTNKRISNVRDSTASNKLTHYHVNGHIEYGQISLFIVSHILNNILVISTIFNCDYFYVREARL